jgi:hypothetical protein
VKTLTQHQTDKLFTRYAKTLYDKFVENSVVLYAAMFPEKCNNKHFDHSYYDMVRQRLIFELQVLYNEAKGEKNAKKKCKAIAATPTKRAAIK